MTQRLLVRPLWVTTLWVPPSQCRYLPIIIYTIKGYKKFPIFAKSPYIPFPQNPQFWRYFDPKAHKTESNLRCQICNFWSQLGKPLGISWFNKCSLYPRLFNSSCFQNVQFDHIVSIHMVSSSRTDPWGLTRTLTMTTGGFYLTSIFFQNCSMWSNLASERTELSLRYGMNQVPKAGLSPAPKDTNIIFFFISKNVRPAFFVSETKRFCSLLLQNKINIGQLEVSKPCNACGNLIKFQTFFITIGNKYHALCFAVQQAERLEKSISLLLVTSKLQAVEIKTEDLVILSLYLPPSLGARASSALSRNPFTGLELRRVTLKSKSTDQRGKIKFNGTVSRDFLLKVF